MNCSMLQLLWLPSAWNHTAMYTDADGRSRNVKFRCRFFSFEELDAYFNCTYIQQFCNGLHLIEGLDYDWQIAMYIFFFVLKMWLYFVIIDQCIWTILY